MLTPAVSSPGVAAVASPKHEGGIPPNANIVHGYDVEALVDAAMGQRPMPLAPVYLDSFGMPLTRLAPTGLLPSAATPVHHQPPQAAAPTPSALEIANAALAAAHGTLAEPTKILVLSNMVMQEDLATDEDYRGLMDEVKEECAKFGKLLGMDIPRKAEGNISPSAILKIFLEYETVQDAQAAEKELKGRKFGDNVVQVGSVLPGSLCPIVSSQFS